MHIVDQAAITRVKEVVAARSNGALSTATQPHADTLHFAVDKQAIRSVVEGLINELQGRFMISVGTDKRPLTGDFAVLHLFSLDAAHLYVLLESPISNEDLQIESITQIIPGANWAEREFRDGVGVRPEGHPDPRRLLLADDWPEGVYPFRRDFPYNYQPPPAENVLAANARTPRRRKCGTHGAFLPGPGGAFLLAPVRRRRDDRGM